MAVDIIVHPDPKRDERAAKLVDQVGAWPKMVLKVAFGGIPAGTVVRRAPSSKNDGTTYKVCSLSCECPDYQQWGNVCKHVRALRLWEARQPASTAVDAPAPITAPRGYADLFPPCKTDGCRDVAEAGDGYCNKCGSDREFAESLEAKRLARARELVANL